MKPDPYTTLGVPKDADGDALKRAYRKKSKKCHPDTAGTDEAQREINAAYAVLCDPDRRKRYDETGESEPPKDSALQELVTMFVGAVAEDTSDPLKFVSQQLSLTSRNVADQQEKYRKLAAKFRLKADKVSRTGDGENLLATALRNQAAELERQALLGEEHLGKFARMLALLDEYKWKLDEPSIANNPWNVFKMHGM